MVVHNSATVSARVGLTRQRYCSVALPPQLWSYVLEVHAKGTCYNYYSMIAVQALKQFNTSCVASMVQRTTYSCRLLRALTKTS